MFYQKYFTIKKLLECGVHYGHRKNKWNPKMAQYIYGIKNKVHIIDLEQTAVLLEKALVALKDVAAKNGRILFVSTKKQSSDVVAAQANRCGQYFVNKRWLGGMLSNWGTVSASIKKMDAYKVILDDEKSTMTKKEKLTLQRKYDKLESVLGGIKTMGGAPDLVFVIDAHKHDIAVKEANKLNIPVCAIVDTNTNPSNIDFIVPGNDDARKAIELYTILAADAILLGIQKSLTNAGVDITNLEDILTAKLELKKKPADSHVKKEFKKAPIKQMKAIKKHKEEDQQAA